MNNKHYSQKISSKIYLRENFKDIYPDYILNNEKTGWRAPIDIWYDKRIRDLYIDIISNAFKNSLYINSKKIIDEIYIKKSYPGKHIQAFLSLAILANCYSLDI